MMYFLCVLAFILMFYFGAAVGITDFKHRFGIPKGAVGVEEDGQYIIS